ncbi:MAG: MmcQ/YjbR family DNA-binding protein [Colwellia sp.]|nr:MmcQ/YjbR family DNA-binding protein [Colwellia sp.]MCW8865123.1 MmcQ/YjbR family DNA-binding protein [Colwellia sp.]MCW9081970.1 MmcQ/YjbR family DNA-binding protein [Colwellia sp.]
MPDTLNAQQVEQYLLSKPETSLYYPFGDDVKVFKVKSKMFATLALGPESVFKGASENFWLNLKCDVNEAVMLRDIFPAILPGYHMHKASWNSVILDGSIPKGELERMMDNSFKLIVSKMTKKDQQSIQIHG